MRIIKSLLLFLIVASCSQSIGDESPIVSKITAQVSGITDECKKLDVIDAEMQRLIAKIKAKYSSEELFEKRFEMSQVYWIQYRDRHVKALYPLDWNTHYRKEYTKEVFNDCKCKENNRMTLIRIKELAFYLEESEEKGDCPAIWNQ
ncbi:lysozyme inhibitor LprI family protein [Ekhidna sp.]